MACVGKLRLANQKLQITRGIIRPVSCTIRCRSTTVIPAVDRKSQPALAGDAVLDFDDSKQAFKSKTTWEIFRALTVFRLCSIDMIVSRNKKVSIFMYLRMVCKPFHKFILVLNFCNVVGSGERHI